MKGIQYNLIVSDSSSELGHGGEYTLTEIYLPDIGIAFNTKGFIFRADGDRYKRASKRLEDVAVSNEDAKLFRQQVETEERAKEVAGKYLKIFK